MFDSILFLKLVAPLFIVLTPIVSAILVKLTGMRKKGANFADLAFPLLVFEWYLISDKAYYNSLLPHLLLALSLLSLGICFYFLYVKREFHYRRFFKCFWRAGFLLTFFLFFALTIALYTLPN